VSVSGTYHMHFANGCHPTVMCIEMQQWNNVMFVTLQYQMEWMIRKR